MKRFGFYIIIMTSIWGQNPISINSLSWLTGSWEGQMSNGKILEEIWLPPRAGSITALVRLTDSKATDFVEIINIMEVNGTLALELQLFYNVLSPSSDDPHRFELTEIKDNFVSFNGVSKGAHRTLSYERTEKNVFYIRFQPHEGPPVEIKLRSK